MKNSTHFPGTTDFEPRAYEAPHRNLARVAASQGIVLLKNEDGILPLKSGESIALFGAGAGMTIKGGTGSGDVNERESISIYRGLSEAGYIITTEKWIREYDSIYNEARSQWKRAILEDNEKRKEQGEMTAFFFAYSSHQFKLPAGGPVYDTEADTAIYVLSRIAGENADRHAAAGDYTLSDDEYAQIKDLCGMYSRVVMIVNAGGVVGLSFMDEFPGIKGLLVVSQPGMEGGRAVADVISGSVSPSGKLTDSWAYKYEDYPNADKFSHNNSNVEKETYDEGIYVGYRYFDSFGIPVRYGFGFGCSYTSFDIDVTEISLEGARVKLLVTVENTGNVSGREVVQVYAGLPFGRLEKEARRLVSFGKTGDLKPGDRETMELEFGPEDMYSFDEAGSCFVMEAGIYGIYVGNSLGASRLAGALELKEEKILKKVKHICPLQEKLEEFSVPKDKRMSRYEEMKRAAEEVKIMEYDLSSLETVEVVYDSECRTDDTTELIEKLPVDKLTALVIGDPSRGQGADEVMGIGSAGQSVPGAAAETSAAALEHGVESIVLADGPAGLRLSSTYYVKDGRISKTPFAMALERGYLYDGPEPEGEKHYQFCTAVPVGTMLAQTWDMKLLEQIGIMVGEEMKEFGVHLWLAPGMNLHRNPLCGRNFEYFAEDPLLSGRCGAAITRGVQSLGGVGTTIKHFACNNQEDNRMASDSILSERALRELYLRGFEVAVKEAAPKAIMTSYNLINGVHAANNRDICTSAARDEFGFKGVIMTDWTTTNVDDKCTAAGCINAGNDLVMPGMPMDHESILNAIEDGSLKIEQLRKCAAHVVRVVKSCTE